MSRYVNAIDQWNSSRHFFLHNLLIYARLIIFGGCTPAALLCTISDALRFSALELVVEAATGGGSGTCREANTGISSGCFGSGDSLK
jgi:hypothetical protein